LLIFKKKISVPVQLPDIIPPATNNKFVIFFSRIKNDIENQTRPPN
jgi:hypothetical protein